MLISAKFADIFMTLKINSNGINLFDPSQIGSRSADAIRNLSAQQIASLDSYQIAALSQVQIAAIEPDKFAALNAS